VRAQGDPREEDRVERFREAVRKEGVTAGTVRRFRLLVKGFFRRRGRTMPWRETTDPYRILVSEVMLQQTQVERVVPKYRSFIRKFPDISSLASAPEAELLAEWQGLGYNRRALFLKKAAQTVASVRRFPRTPDELRRLPGVGPACAGAIAAFAFNLPSVFVETNIRRVFVHCFFPGERKVQDSAILPLVERTLDRKDPRRWYYGLMDLGAFLGDTLPNPNRRSASHRRQSRFEGSFRQVRAKVLRLLLSHPGLTPAEARRLAGADAVRVRQALAALAKDGFAEKKGGRWFIRNTQQDRA